MHQSQVGLCTAFPCNNNIDSLVFRCDDINVWALKLSVQITIRVSLGYRNYCFTGERQNHRTSLLICMQLCAML